jgi:glycosyltransferase involved in cell wall biosynthesis
MKIAYIGTYPPRECGIGTFTHNKFMSISHLRNSNGENHEGMVIAVSDLETKYDYPQEVEFVIRQEQQGDYIEAAAFINRSGADICILEHEFGIFGGQNGVYILPLLYRLEIPLIAVFHTVLKTPSLNEKGILTEICRMASKTVVMTARAVSFLTEIYGINTENIEIIEHGVPDLQYEAEKCKKEFKLENKKVLLSFGLISRNKGLETVIKSLPPVVAQYPEVVYIILGKTHPHVLKQSGEEYRIYLMRLVKQLHLEKHVLFMNEFVNQNKLFKYLSAADIYITPYLNEAQITSGTLAYAVGAGCAVISTPYWHATELLDRGRGCLFNFNDHEQLSSILLDLLDDPDNMHKMRKRAFQYGRGITWPMIGEKYIELAHTIFKQQNGAVRKNENILDPLILPPFSLDHIKRMTDDTGIIQHAKFGIPNLKEGYCLDDNARALLMVLMAYEQKKLPLAMELMPVYLSYIHYMQNDNGNFRNFFSFNRNFLDEQGSEDSFGRTIWAIGYLLGNAPNDAYYQSGKEIFYEAVPHFEKLQSLRGIANTITGIVYYMKTVPADLVMMERVRKMSNILVDHYKSCTTDSWKWFEPVLTYDNAILPLSLLHASSILNDETILEIAMESLHFLSEVTLKNGYLSVIGNETWYNMNGQQSIFAQQPLDVMAMVLLFQKAFQITDDRTYLNNMYTCFMWFLGENDLRMSLYDHETKGCCDGLESYGVNRNQGAESTLSYLIAHLAVLQTFNEAYSTGRNEGWQKNKVKTGYVHEKML